METFKELESRKMGNMIWRSSEVIAVEDSIAPRSSSRGHDGKIKIMPNQMRTILDVLCKCQDERTDVRTPTDFHWKVFLVLLSICCDILEWKDMLV